MNKRQKIISLPFHPEIEKRFIIVSDSLIKLQNNIEPFKKLVRAFLNEHIKWNKRFNASNNKIMDVKNTPGIDPKAALRFEETIFAIYEIIIENQPTMNSLVYVGDKCMKHISSLTQLFYDAAPYFKDNKTNFDLSDERMQLLEAALQKGLEGFELMKADLKIQKEKLQEEIIMYNTLGGVN